MQQLLSYSVIKPSVEHTDLAVSCKDKHCTLKKESSISYTIAKHGLNIQFYSILAMVNKYPVKRMYNRSLKNKAKLENGH